MTVVDEKPAALNKARAANGAATTTTATATETATETETPEPKPAPETPSPRVEARGVWVTRWDFNTADDVVAIMDSCAAGGFNQVYFQVRGTADAYYRSSLEPWAAPLSGKLGQDPGWDPLRVAVEAAHERKLQLHAWINVATAWKGTLPPGKSRPAHILRAHPGWRMVYKDGRPMPYADAYIFVNPANPEFGAHIQAVVAEMASFYEVDGVHFDYARYPSADTSYDRVSNRLYKQAKKNNPELTREAWQREELARLVRRLAERVREVRPAAVVSAAVTGVYQDRWEWREVVKGFSDFHQDSHLWAKTKAVDVLVPMIYWKPTDPPGGKSDYLTLVRDFAPLLENVQLLSGINVEAGDFEVLEREIRIARENGYQGVVLFAYDALKKRGWFEKLKAGVFREAALPRAPRKVAVKP
jgi:uncharacterized lipoprotein YddW (UPF0748 family)